MTNKQSKTKDDIKDELTNFIWSMYACTKDAIKSTNESNIQNNIIRMYKNECIGATDFLWRAKFIDLADLGYFQNKINDMFSNLFVY